MLAAGGAAIAAGAAEAWKLRKDRSNWTQKGTRLATAAAGAAALEAFRDRDPPAPDRYGYGYDYGYEKPRKRGRVKSMLGGLLLSRFAGR